MHNLRGCLRLVLPPIDPTRPRNQSTSTSNALESLIDTPDLTAQIHTQLHSTLPEAFLTNSVIDPSTGRAMEYRELISNPSTKKLGNFQGPTNLAFFSRVLVVV